MRGVELRVWRSNVVEEQNARGVWVERLLRAAWVIAATLIGLAFVDLVSYLHFLVSLVPR